MRVAVVASMLLVASLHGEEGKLPPWHWSKVDLSIFSTRAPERLADSFGGLTEQGPSEEVMDEVLDRLARNDEFREWLVDFYEVTPVTWENYRQRSRPLWVLQHLRAEWSVRFLLELSKDERPMTSSKYDYDSPAFLESLREYARSHPGDAADHVRRTGYDVRGRSRDLAERNLAQIPFAGAPSKAERMDKELWMSDWLLAPAQRDRLPELLQETWGDKVVLNVELGLGPDNRPLTDEAGSGSDGDRERRPIAERSKGGLAEVGGTDSTRSIPRVPLVGAVLVLLAGVIVWLRSRSR